MLFWQKEILNLPDTDSPELFGMHVNADITFRNKQTSELIGTIIDTQPKTGGGGGGLSREEVVVQAADDLLSKLPDDFDMIVVRECIVKLGGMSKPLNVVLALAAAAPLVTLVVEVPFYSPQPIQRD